MEKVQEGEKRPKEAKKKNPDHFMKVENRAGTDLADRRRERAKESQRNPNFQANGVSPRPRETRKGSKKVQHLDHTQKGAREFRMQKWRVKNKAHDARR